MPRAVTRLTKTGAHFMGLDQYAYVSHKPLVAGRAPSERREISYWRKHGALQDWMHDLWLKKLDVPAEPGDQFILGTRPPEEFNCVELELTWEDLDELEAAVKTGELSLSTKWYGTRAPEEYKERDLEFIKNARAELFMGLRVFYYPSW